MPESISLEIFVSPDLLDVLFAKLTLFDSPFARVCTAWRHAWARKLANEKDSLRFVQSVGQFRFARRVVAMNNGGVLVPNYGRFCLETFNAQGAKQSDLIEDVLVTPGAVALVGDGTAWVVQDDIYTITKVRLDDGEILVENIAHDMPYPEDIAIAGDALLVLSNSWDEDEGTAKATINVCSAAGGELRLQFSVCEAPGDEGPAESMAVLGDMVYVTDIASHQVHVLRHSDGQHVRTIGGPGSAPGLFDHPTGVAISHDRLYVSEGGYRQAGHGKGGRCVQVLTLDGEPLHVIPSPDGKGLAGICIDSNRVWVMSEKASTNSVHIFEVIE